MQPSSAPAPSLSPSPAPRAGTLGKGEEPSPCAGRRRWPINAIVVTNADQ